MVSKPYHELVAAVRREVTAAAYRDRRGSLPVVLTPEVTSQIADRLARWMLREGMAKGDGHAG